ncbi:hypothetical protein OG535_12995 [Kitasatospora sp. NBC_00085]|uniref:hypothetical protein n=1 Tax=unclassified Kitasatospora TaxID=2633591 RepID=UPI00324C8405
MTSTASHSATPPHGRPAPGTGAADAEGPLPVGPSDPAGPAGPRGPWAVRSVRATRGRAALEVYEHGELLDVLVAARLTPQLLRGARRCAVPGARGRYGLAWGRLPQGGAAPAVRFTGGWLRRAGGRAVEVPEVITVAGEFWIAWARGRFGGVLVEHAGGRERQPLARVRGRRRGAPVGTAGGQR